MSKPNAENRQDARQAAVSSMKQTLILDAARAIFESDGIEGASIRAIAKRAGYTPGAIYFHFASKEDIYAALLDQSLDRAIAAVHDDFPEDAPAMQRMHLAGKRIFDFYADNPGELDLGFYLFRGGMKPHGLGRDRDRALNGKFLRALQPFKSALTDFGYPDVDADAETAGFFAHVSGLLLLKQTGRLRLFDTDVQTRITAYLDELEQRAVRAVAVRAWTENHEGP
ncbi:MAG: helix-turn-helix domain-containing protein [Rhodospirillales bacterium]